MLLDPDSERAKSVRNRIHHTFFINVSLYLYVYHQRKAETSWYLEHGALAALAGLCYYPQVPGPLHVRLDLLGGPASGVGQRFHQHTVTNTQLHPFPRRGQPESFFYWIEPS